MDLLKKANLELECFRYLIRLSCDLRFINLKHYEFISQQVNEIGRMVGGYKQFCIYDSKKRLISAAPYRDRVVQHALCNIIEPIFDRIFVYDSYACRKGKGSHEAVERFTEFSRKNDYVLKCDVKSYFASIDLETLWQFILGKIKDKQALWLIRQIIDSTVSPGIPIGNLASQIFANLYLNELDHSLKEDIKCTCYLRYMDDLVVFGSDKTWLTTVRGLVRTKLAEIKLVMHEDKSRIYETKNGVPFLGYHIWPSHRLVLTQNIRRFRLRMKKYFKLLERGVINSQRISSLRDKPAKCFAAARGTIMTPIIYAGRTGTTTTASVSPNT